MQAIVEDRDRIRTNREQDVVIEAVVLKQVLSLHPGLVTQAELIRELGCGEEDFALRDSVERAVRDLVGCGLLHRSESLIMPSRAALRFEELLDG